MSKGNETKTEEQKGRARVGNLPQDEKELKDREAQNIKGGGGAGGGVLGDRHIGEEIPQLAHIGEEIPQ